jgi:Raf kinase inhibitor-like YbhB/YbcL family protein
MAFVLRSPAFGSDEKIPGKYTCDGTDASVPLKWEGAPAGTKYFCLICDDPDAPNGDWAHWVLYDLPAGVSELPEGVPADEELANGALQGINDFRTIGYGGPCPPKHTHEHRYFFTLYALGRKAGLPARATRRELLDAMKGRILGQARLTGRYER